jgi:hypothetical protein
MTLVLFSQSNLVLYIFSSKLYKIRAQPLDYLAKNLRSFISPTFSLKLYKIRARSLDYLG